MYGINSFNVFGCLSVCFGLFVCLRLARTSFLKIEIEIWAPRAGILYGGQKASIWEGQSSAAVVPVVAVAILGVYAKYFLSKTESSARV